MRDNEMDFKQSMDGNASGPRQIRPPAAPTPSVAAFELCNELKITTVGDNTARLVPVGPVLRGIGVYTAGIVVMAYGKYCTTNFQWGVIMQWSLDGETWSSDVTLLALQTGSGQAIGAEVADRQKFGLFLRFFIQVDDNSSSAVQTGAVSARVNLRLLT